MRQHIIIRHGIENPFKWNKRIDVRAAAERKIPFDEKPKQIGKGGKYEVRQKERLHLFVQERKKGHIRIMVDKP